MSTSDPLVSVVLPTYNRAELVATSMRSVLKQSYEDLELIVVDDASADDTEAVVEQFEDDRVRYIAHEANRGAPAARNTGIEAARGEYIAFQDSDDKWLFDKLERQLGAFRAASPDVGVVYTGMVRVEGGEWKYLPYPGIEQKDGDIEWSLTRQNFISTPVAMVRRECLETVGAFDENTWPLSDWELWIRISGRYQFELVDEVLVVGEVQPDSISTDFSALVRARERVVEKHSAFFDSRSLARQLFYIGNGSMKIGDSEKAKAYLIRALRTDPRPIYVAALLLSAFPIDVYSVARDVYKRI